MAAIKYRPEIDGLRAVAVIPVIFFHMGIKGIEGGYLGVDVFFVISGFLITSIILREFDESRFTFGRFWERRVRRIFPALMAMILSTSVAASFILFKGDSPALGLQGASAALSFANIVFWRLSGDYWGPDANESPFLHTWSLSVEEQFYLLYPFLLVFLMKFARRWIMAAIALIAACSFAAYLLGSTYKPIATFYLLPMRAWELACGCLLAAWLRTPRKPVARPVSSVLALCGLVAVISSFFFFSPERSFNGYLAIPVIASVLIIGFAGEEGCLAGKFLSHPAIVFIGKISYSLYLWHWPVIVLGSRLRYRLGWEPSLALLLIVIGLLSILSYRFIEVPTRHSSFKSSGMRLTFASFAVILLFSSYIYKRSTTHDISMYGQVMWEGNSYDVCPRDAWDAKLKAGIVVTPRDDRAHEAYATGGIIKRYGTSTPEVVLLGDSHALMWAGTIDRIARDQGITISFYAASATPPFLEIPVKKSSQSFIYFTPDQKYIFDKSRLGYLAQWKPKVVIISSRWSSPFTNYGESLPGDLIEYIGQIGAKVIFIMQPPELPFNNKDMKQSLASLGIYPEEGQRRYIKSAHDSRDAIGRKLVRDACLKYPFCSAIEVSDIYRSGNDDGWVLDGPNLLYMDDDHLSQFGAEKAQQRIRDALQSALSTASKGTATKKSDP